MGPICSVHGTLAATEEHDVAPDVLPRPHLDALVHDGTDLGHVLLAGADACVSAKHTVTQEVGHRHLDLGSVLAQASADGRHSGTLPRLPPGLVERLHDHTAHDGVDRGREEDIRFQLHRVLQD